VAMLKQVRIPRVYSVVVEQIRALIESGELKPGDKLPTERSLAEQLGISRSSVREALSALEVLGVIQSRQGLGNYVANHEAADLSEDKFEDLIEAEGTLEIVEARLLFEPGAAALAAQRRTEADLRALQSCITEMERLVGEGQDSWEPDWGFHVALANACHNPMVTALADVITQRVRGRLWQLMREQNYAGEPERPRQYLERHRRIYQAIVRGDSEAAEDAVRRHLAEITENLSDGGA
jgi:GntR family transcriptional repressor for pyruvate dehydrogenase complex